MMEYQVTHLDTLTASGDWVGESAMTTQLNEMAAQGWRLVTASEYTATEWAVLLFWERERVL